MTAAVAAAAASVAEIMFVVAVASEKGHLAVSVVSVYCSTRLPD